MAIKEIYLMRLIASFGSFRRSKSTILLLLIYSLSGLGLIPLILSGEESTGNLFTQMILQYPILYLFPTLFLFYSIISQISVVDYERDFIFSTSVKPYEVFYAKTLYDLTMILFILFLPFIFAFVAVILLLKVFYIAFFAIVFLILSLSVILENSFKVLTIFYKKNLVRLLIVFVILAFCAPVILNFAFGDTPRAINLISPIGALQELLISRANPSEMIAPVASFFIWAIFSITLFYKASRFNFLPFAQVVPLRAAFDTSFRYQVQKQQYLLSRMNRFSIPIYLENAPRSKVLFYAKESFVRTLRFGDIYGLILTLVFLSLPYFLIGNSNLEDFTQTSFPMVMFLAVFFPIILTQLWITEFVDYFWIIKAFSSEVRSYIIGTFTWQMSIFLPLMLISQVIVYLLTGPISFDSILFSTLLVIVNSSFGVYYGIWTIKRKSFTPYIFMMGMLFFVLLSTPIIMMNFIGKLFMLPSLYNLALTIASLIYTIIAASVFLFLSIRMFELMEV
ncbi:MAG: hypothetical protein QXJ17_07255 [Nitrososphaeria archaeon]